MDLGVFLRPLFMFMFIAGLPVFCGCAFYPRAQNPLPGVYRVAVLDFVDKTNGAEGLDTAAVTEMFASELQKIPTYEVVPVQEVREVLGPVRIDTNQPQLAFEVARALHAQAIIVGAVTEYNAYYPPRVGLHCEMYAMVTGQPEAVVQSPPAELERAGGFTGLDGLRSHDHHAKKDGHPHAKHGKRWWKRSCELPVETQPIPDVPPDPVPPEETPVPIEQVGYTSTSVEDFSPSNLPPDGVVAPVPSLPSPEVSPVEETTEKDEEGWGPVSKPAGLFEEEDSATAADYLAGQVSDYRISVVAASDPIPIVEPWVIRHSRIFDSSNHGFTRKLKDFYYFQDDLRGGDWQGYVLRNDDFTRFACNQMIFEMLEAAGGDWMTLFGVRYAKPWQPWPPR